MRASTSIAYGAFLSIVFNAPSAGASDVYRSPERFVEATAENCDLDRISFEGEPYGDLPDPPDAPIRFVASTGRPQVDDIVSDSRCRATRCVRTSISRDAGETLPPWIRVEPRYPTPALGLYVIDPGVGDRQERTLFRLTLVDGTVEEHLLALDGDDRDGGVFIAFVSGIPIEQLQIEAPVAGDGMGIDDVSFAPRRCLDLDGDGQSPFLGDCDDEDSLRSTLLDESCDGLDNDCDGVIPQREFDTMRHGWLDCEDPDGDGQSFADGDCAPFDEVSFLGAPELCDGVDNDCDDEVPPWEADADIDGARACDDPDQDGVTEADGDCAPRDPTVWPGAPELCDGKDNDCDGEVPRREADADIDGARACDDPDQDGVTEADGDCAPRDPTVWPGAPELCDGKDNDCDGALPWREGDPDLDGILMCQDPDRDGMAEADGDCAPFDSAIYLDAPEICDGKDNDCDGAVPAREHDWDLDGILACEDPDLDGMAEADGDCDPFDPTTYSGASELCDGKDNDCDGRVPDIEADTDKDGFRICQGDCADLDPMRHPGAPERENGWDDNCDGESTGGTVGCTAAPTAPPMTRGQFQSILSLFCFLWFAFRVLRRRKWDIWLAAPIGVFVVGTGISAELDDDDLDYVRSRPYQDELRVSNHGRLLVVQVAQHVFRDAWLSHLAPSGGSGDACRIDLDCPLRETCDGDQCVATHRVQADIRLPCIPGLPCLGDLAFDAWLDGLDVNFERRDEVTTSVAIAGVLSDSGPLGLTGEMYGPIRVTHELSIEGTCAGDRPNLGLVLSAPEIDLDGLVFESYLDRVELRSTVTQQIEESLRESLEELSFDLTGTVCSALNPERIPQAMAGVIRKPGPQGNHPGRDRTLVLRHPDATDIDLRLVTDPSDDGEPFLMLGWDPVNLPRCHRESTDDHPLFAPEAFQTFNTRLIAPGDDLALSISTRLLRRVLWNLVWNTRVGRETTLQQFDRQLREAASHDLHKSTSVERFVHWEGQERHPIDDPDARWCDGDIEGTYLLDLESPSHPRLRSFTQSKVTFGCGCIDTSVEMEVDLALRLYIDNRDGHRPELAIERTVFTNVDSGCIADRCGAEQVRTTRAAIERMDSDLRTEIPASLFGVSHGLGPGRTFLLDQVIPHAATLTFSGEVSYEAYPLTSSNPWPALRPVLPRGAIAGLNARRPEARVLVDGADPTLRNCPRGWLSRSAEVDGVLFEWCESTPDGRQAQEILPSGTWCGLDVHPRHREELCDDLDNDGDGSVDESFVVDPDTNVPECLADDSRPVEFVSMCEGLVPREECPEGYAAFGVWHDESFRLCRYDPSQPQQQPCGDLAEATFVTCVSGEQGRVDWNQLPSGLVVNGEISGYSETAPGCPAPYFLVEQDTGWRGTKRLPILSGLLQYCTLPDAGLDWDSDGLNSPTERFLGTWPLLRSTDGDPFPDGWEATEGLDPLHHDSDRDGLSDLAELFVFLTDPVRRDTDGDRLPDGYEVFVTGDDPGQRDSDGDGIVDGWEEGLEDMTGPDLGDEDRDGDGLPDGYERWVTGTDPSLVDSDRDGVPDPLEAHVRGVDDGWYAGAGPWWAEGEDDEPDVVEGD